jgi:hypothetical protein
MPKKKIIAASALLAPFALAAISIFPDSKTPAISPSQVSTWDCEYPERKPKAITLTCADGGMYVDQIDWSRWDSQGAQGVGIYNVNKCDPSCAEGTYSRTRVKVHLSRLTEYKGEYFLRTLVIRTPAGENLPNEQVSSNQWDLMEFVEMYGR